MLAASAVWADDLSNERLSYDQNPHQNYDQSGSDLYRAREWSFDAFGTEALSQHSIDNLSGHRIRHDSTLGAGIGANYFFLRYVGVGVEGYTENTEHSFVDDLSGSLIGRLPIGHTGLAPYAFVGAGHKFDPVVATYEHVGAGLEYRFTPNIGIFIDGRFVWCDRIQNYGLGRVGVRFAF